MFRNTMICALAGATMMTAAPALAQRGPLGGGGPPAGVGGMGHAGGMIGGPSGMGSMGGMNSIGLETRDAARVNSQGPVNASTTAIGRANANSVLSGTSTTTTPLTGVTTGMALSQNGTQVGTVTRVSTNGRGVITRVLVRGTNGQIYSVAPSTLTLSGGTLSTSTTLRTR